MRVVARVTEHLDLGSETANPAARNGPETGEPGGGIDPVLAALHPIDAVARFVEHHGMDVDLAAFVVGQLEAHRCCTAHTTVAPSCQQRLERPHCAELYDEIQVVMRTRLCLEHRIDAPPSVEPHLDADRLEDVEKVNHLLGAHLQARHAAGPGDRRERPQIDTGAPASAER